MKYEIDVTVKEYADGSHGLLRHTIRRKIIECDSEVQADVMFTIIERICSELLEV